MDNLFRIRTIAQYSVYEGWRGQVILTSVLIIFTCIVIAEFGGLLVITDTWQTKVSIYAFITRIALVAICMSYVINALIRDRMDKQTEWFLSIDSPRHIYLYGRTLGFLIVATGITVIAGLYPALYAENVSTVAWIISLYAEIAVIILMSVFFAVTINNLVFDIVGVFAFYILSRSIGNIILLTESPVVKNADVANDLLNNFIAVLHVLIPDFWKYADTACMLQANVNISQLVMNIAEALIFCLLIIFAASIDIYRKNY